MTKRRFPHTTLRPARNRKEQRVRLAKLEQAGIPPRVPAGPATEHLRGLIELGMTRAMIAWQTGLPEATIRQLADGSWSQAHVTVARKVMDANTTPAPSMASVLTIGALRRVRALQAFGWTTAMVAGQIGMDQSQLSALQRRTRIEYRVWVRVRDVYEQLSSTPGPSDQSRRYAARKGWLNPFEWEGYDIDDPRVTPPRSARNPRDRSGARADRLEQVAELTAQGLSAEAIADQLGVSERQVQRDRSAA